MSRALFNEIKKTQKQLFIFTVTSWLSLLTFQEALCVYPGDFGWLTDIYCPLMFPSQNDRSAGRPF